MALHRKNQASKLTQSKDTNTYKIRRPTQTKPIGFRGTRVTKFLRYENLQ